MKNLSESKIIKNIQRKVGKTNFLQDDVEIFDFKKNKIVLKIDTLVESTDIPHKMSLVNAARKSVVSAVSDFAAKGIRPEVGLVSLILPNTITKKQIEQIANGLADGAKQYGFRIIGGDTNEGKEVSISIVLCGISNTITKRGGAKTGDRIFVTGNFGYTLSGIQILSKKCKATKKFYNKAMNAIMFPKARLDFGVSAMKFCNASMDSSDGLSTTLNQMARDSHKQFIITHEPTTNEVIEFSRSNNIDSRKLIFDGGEEYEIVFTASSSNLPKIEKIARSTSLSLIEIGYVKNGTGVFLRGKKNERIMDQGWQHFKKIDWKH